MRADSESISCVYRQQCLYWHLLFMSEYFKENESTCETSPTLLVIFTARCREWAPQRCCRMENALRLWLKWKTSEISLTTVAIWGELVIPPTLKSDKPEAAWHKIHLSALMHTSGWGNRTFFFLSFFWITATNILKISAQCMSPIEWRSFLRKK